VIDTGKVACRDAWLKFKTAAGAAALARAVETQDNARSKGHSKRPVN
jgi:hypothetical protein